MIQTGDSLHSITLFLANNIFYLLLAVMALNMFQRRYQQHAQKKRMATLYLGILILAFMVGTILIVNFNLPDLLIFPLAAAVLLLQALGHLGGAGAVVAGEHVHGPPRVRHAAGRVQPGGQLERHVVRAQ